MVLTFGSLFAGIGGMDLGLERAGLTCRWQVEIDDYCRRVLTKHWPDVPKYGDIREVSGEGLERVDLICGGFPCQDISNAGKRAGIDGERSGLWSEYIRLVRVLRPRYVLVENVAALLGRGVDRVLGDLAASGYDCEWDCLPAAAVGAPHLRDRLFVVAYPTGARHATTGGGNGLGIWSTGAGLGAGLLDEPGDDGEARALADAHCGRRQQRHQEERGIPEPDAIGAGPGALAYTNSQWQQQPQGRIGNVGGWVGDSGTADRGHWRIEPPVGRVADGIPGRVDRLRGLGNAVVPQVAEFIGRRILATA